MNTSHFIWADASNRALIAVQLPFHDTGGATTNPSFLLFASFFLLLFQAQQHKHVPASVHRDMGHDLIAHSFSETTQWNDVMLQRAIANPYTHL